MTSKLPNMTREALHELLRLAAAKIDIGEPLPTGASPDGRARYLERDVVVAVLRALGAGEPYTARLPRLRENDEQFWGPILRDVDTEARRAGAEILGRSMRPGEHLPRGALAAAYRAIAGRDGVTPATVKQRHMAAKRRQTRDFARLRK